MKLTRAVVLLAIAGCSSATQEAPSTPTSTFFLTSAGPGNGANLGGIAGADRHCAMLADAAGIRNKTWRAYLSQPAAGNQPAVNARDRIGRGPWHNVKGQLIASDVNDLHSDNAKWTKQTVLNERGEVVNGRGDTPNRHDILTGSTLTGTVITGSSDNFCNNYTSQDTIGAVRVGHFDKVGGGENPTSWNSAHASRGCSQANLRATGGDGLFYCFAI